MNTNTSNCPVYVYTHTPIAPYGSGTQIRQYTNVRAYLDLGFDVEVIQFSNTLEQGKVVLPDGARHTLAQSIRLAPDLYSRLAYKLGFPLEAALSVLYVDRQSVLNAVEERERLTPGAIHHFEYPATANVSISLRGRNLNLVWSCHDWESDRNRKVGAMREEIGCRKQPLEKIRRYYFARQVEKKIARHCKLVLMIAEHETRIFRDRFGIQNAELLPMSWPDETMPSRQREWVEGGQLRMLHVGSPHSMIGYYSLKFILGDVFPLIPTRLLDKMELIVAGQILDTGYSRTIRDLASPYPQVKFLGYVDDLLPLYASSDIHLVGASLATGLRTRIIESFVYGVPVISVTAAAEGIAGLSHGHNILLQDTPHTFAKQLIELQRQPSLLPDLAKNGRQLYENFYSRQVAAQRLRACLENYL